MAHNLIFEGAELAGKSWLMSQVYDHLERKYNTSENILDGCLWLNCDLGIFGSRDAEILIQNYLDLFEKLKHRNIIVEKFCISDAVYQFLYRGKQIDYREILEKLKILDFKIILINFLEDQELIKSRIQDRLNLYPHYARIVKDADWYIEQQKLYKEKINNSPLPVLEITTNKLPDEKLVDDILKWIGEG